MPKPGARVNGTSSGGDKAKMVKVAAEAPDGPSLGVSLKALAILSMFYLSFSYIAIKAMYMGFVVPLSSNAALDKFSEGRAMEHIVALAGENAPRRLEGTDGLHAAAKYIKDELISLKARASPNIRFEIDESLVDGSFNMEILRHNLSFTYRNHMNVAARVSAKGAPEDAASLLLNAHFDAPLSSPGAADCASCVASLLETLRQIIDTEWIPSAPVIFLFNGAEEIFLLGSHGFITTHKWRDTIGAAINVEASGAGGPDLVVQSGPGAWPSRVYSESAVHPMANSAAQSIFPLIPGDTDYRMFSQDFGDIPGLDLVWLLNGAVYHTAYDRPEIIVPGALQVRGDNLMALVRGFTSAPELKGSVDRAKEKEALKGQPEEKRPIFFDIWGKWMFFYSHKFATMLHLLPLLMVSIVPNLSSPSDSGLQTVGARVSYLLQGFMIQLIGLVLALVFPVILAIMRLSVSSSAMTWFAQPWIALSMFVPCSMAGLLIPRVAWMSSKRQAGVKQDVLDWGGHWGTVALNAVASVLVTHLGSAGYLDFMWAMVLIPSFIIFRWCQRAFGPQSLWALVGYLVPASFPMAYSIYFGGILVQFVSEKAGMMGSNPLPAGFYVADVIMAVLIGFFLVMSVSPVIPIMARWIGKADVVRLLLYVSVAAAALSSQAFPYTMVTPKRLVLQQTIITPAVGEEPWSSYDFASLDPNPVSFIWKHVPSAAGSLQLTKSQIANDIQFNSSNFLNLYPITSMLSRGTSIPVTLSPAALSIRFPKLRVIGEEKNISMIQGGEKRRIHLELDIGDLQEVWGAVMNISGPLQSWSFAGGELSGTERVQGGPQSYICRISGHGVDKPWKFWLEASGTLPLTIELSVLDQEVDSQIEWMASLLPPWVATNAGTTYISTYRV